MAEEINDTIENEVDAFMDEHAGVASVTELATFLVAPESAVRKFARANGVRRIGSTYCFDREAAHALADEVSDGADEDEDEDDTDEDDTDEDDTDEDDTDEDDTDEDAPLAVR